MRIQASIFVLFASVMLLASCSKNKLVSPTTGWAYNNPDNGGFEYPADFKGQATGPNLVLIEGGAFTVGRVEQDVMYDWNNIPRRVTVSSYYIDETEVRNIDYREYLFWLNRVYVDYPQVYDKAVPDTLVWRRRLAYNEPFVEYYFRHPAFRDYPVVGVSWKQADAYCGWRTDRVNEQILVDQGIFEVNPNQTNEESFNTDAYLAGQYEGLVKEKLKNLNPKGEEEGRNVRIEDGIFLPKYELPTEAQWEYAALGLIGNSADERVFSRKLYPWNGHYVRNDTKDFRGQMMANFQRGRGDLMGIAGALNDAAAPTAPVDAYWPNDYGLFCMAGNVNEWVRDVYRPLSSMDMNEFNPFRGNVFETKLRDEEGNLAEKDSLGHMRYREVTQAECADRWNYNRSDNINYLDGDLESSIVEGGDWTGGTTQEGGSKRMYLQGAERKAPEGWFSMVSDKSRVYKGGSWRDRTYWMVPGTRRYLDENEARDDLGFRCAMIRVGSPQGN